MPHRVNGNNKLLALFLSGNIDQLRSDLNDCHCRLLFVSVEGFEFLSPLNEKFFVYRDGLVSKRN